jgi:hypothetical protein
VKGREFVLAGSANPLGRVSTEFSTAAGVNGERYLDPLGALFSRKPLIFKALPEGYS